MCDYQFPNKPGSTIPYFCPRAAQFWVQSLMSQHNSLVCAHHLARTVRDMEKTARKYDVLTHEYDPDERYEKRDATGKKVTRTTKEDSNYARVTVKPYNMRKGDTD